jgi:hypothetical protein
MAPFPEDAFDLTTDLRTRIVNLEHWRTQRDIADARAEEQKKHMDMRFDQLESQIASLKSSFTSLISRIAWIVFGGFLTALVAFALKGGFNVIGG